MFRSTAVLGTISLTLAATAPARAQADLNDLQMAHVAVTASDIDIAYARLALARSHNAAVRRFAETMISDHGAVNAQIAALAKRLGVQAQDNAVSRQLLEGAERIKTELSRLRGADFDRYYMNNELKYHRAVNDMVANAFIPHIENPEVKQAFQGALTIFRGHEQYAESVVRELAAR